MTITLNLPPNLADELTTEAARLGLSLSEYALRLLATGQKRDMPKTGADLVAYWKAEGLVGTRTDIADSQVHAREIRRQAEKREHS
jgi:hypothetical protein